MRKFEISEIVTRDKLVHQGLFFKPEKRGKKAILWIHGLTDNFYGDFKTLEAFAEVCEALGWGVAAFNNRGHDIVTSIAQVDNSPKGYTHFTGGAGVERFTDCIYDLDAGISFLVKQGFREVILVGISTGANKACYYAGTRRDKRVAAVVLASAISDVPGKLKELGKTYQKFINNLEKLVKTEAGKLQNDLDYMPLTPERFLSLYRIGSPEDVFPYYREHPNFSVFTRISQPLMVVMAGADEYADRPVGEIVKVFRTYQHSTSFRSVVIPGAFHSFGGKEKEFTKEVVDWIKTL